MRLRSRAKRPGAFDPLALAWRVHGFPQVPASLHVQPEVRAVTEDAGKDQLGRRGYGHSVVAKLINMLALHAHGLSQRALRQSHRLHEFLDQDFANAWRLALRH